MYQSFEAATRPETARARVADLRAAMSVEKVDAFIVPRADAHQGEYVAACDERLAWLTSFTGSAGYAAILQDKAGIFVDGRYTLQVRDQVDLDVFTPLNHPKDKLGDWLADALPEDAKVAYDPWLYTVTQIEKLEKEAPTLTFVPTKNLIDQIWVDRPASPKDLMVPHPLKFAGEAHEDKIKRLANGLQERGITAAALTLTDSIAWLLNTRGTDLGQTPATLAFAILYDDATVDLFLDPAKADDTLIQHLGKTVSVHDRSSFVKRLCNVAGPVALSKTSAPILLTQELERTGKAIEYQTDPTSIPKACKNETELAGAKAAHLRDGAAMVEFLAWLASRGEEPKVSEIDVVKALEEKRRATNALKNISFDTICGSGPNGAIVHYRVTEGTNRQIKKGDVLLVDSGGQYLDGTTDITRTMAIGPQSDDAKEAFTLVLKGMIAISKTRFPKGLAGRDIDPLARAPLWERGRDFDHGTGHGVGSFLAVHEGPQGISRAYNVAFKPGMIVSNEPGYYREGAFGIRIENLVYVAEAKAMDGADDRDMYEFKTLTCVPIDRNMIVVDLLDSREIAWLNSYHEWIEKCLADRVSNASLAWLTKACAPL